MSIAFSGGIAAWEQSHMRKTIQLKIFPSLLFYQFISKPFASHSIYVIYQWPTVLEKILTTSKFRSTFAVINEVNKHNEAKKLSGICCTVVSDHTQQTPCFCEIFCLFCNTINEVCLEPLWPSCGHGVNSILLLGLPNGFMFCYLRCRSVETWWCQLCYQAYMYLQYVQMLLNNTIYEETCCIMLWLLLTHHNRTVLYTFAAFLWQWLFSRFAHSNNPQWYY